MRSAIVILNYNGEQHLQTYLPSVVENSSNWDIIVADNASGTNRDWYMPSVTLTPSGELPIVAEDLGYEVRKRTDIERVQMLYEEILGKLDARDSEDRRLRARAEALMLTNQLPAAQAAATEAMALALQRGRPEAEAFLRKRLGDLGDGGYGRCATAGSHSHDCASFRCARY